MKKESLLNFSIFIHICSFLEYSNRNVFYLESCDFVKKYDYCNGMIHSVKKGDSLYTLSRQYDVPLALLLRANPYVDIYNMQVGDEICIPFLFSPPPSEAPSKPAPPQTPPVTPNRPPAMVPSRPPMRPPERPFCRNRILYVVKENDTLASILDYFDLELEDLLKCNSMDDIKLLPGNQIQITLPEDTEDRTD